METARTHGQGLSFLGAPLWRRVLGFLTREDLCTVGLALEPAHPPPLGERGRSEWLDALAALVTRAVLSSRPKAHEETGRGCLRKSGRLASQVHRRGAGGHHAVVAHSSADWDAHRTNKSRRGCTLPELTSTEMSSRQIVPQADAQAVQRRAKEGPPRPVATASSSLGMLFQRITMTRRRRAQQQHKQRASWPLVHTDGRREGGFARRAHQSLLNAWAAIHRDSSATRSSDSLFAPPQFLLRTKRKLSQRFNLKIVQAVGKDVRRIESQRRSSLTALEAPGSHSSLASASSDSSDDLADEFPLKISERISLSLGRSISRDFAPMLTEGTPVECRVREMVYSLLRDPNTLEGHVCSSFFTKQEDFTSPLPAACRYYLNRVRDTVSDLVQFIVEYRLREMLDAFTPLDNQDEAEFEAELEHAVRRAVEEYFCFSLRYEIRHWSTNAANVEHRSRFRKSLAKWSALPSTSREFGLKSKNPDLAADDLIATAIEKLQNLETIRTPSKKMENVLAACHALSEFISRGHGESKSSCSGSAEACEAAVAAPLSPSSRVCLGDADSFLPLLIFAVSRSKLRDPFAQCAMLHGLYPFASQFGERMYYLTMLEASLEFIRTHS